MYVFNSDTKATKEMLSYNFIPYKNHGEMNIVHAFPP